jgi:hypothetical protein
MPKPIRIGSAPKVVSVPSDIPAAIEAVEARRRRRLKVFWRYGIFFALGWKRLGRYVTVRGIGFRYPSFGLMRIARPAGARFCPGLATPLDILGIDLG